jgi:hypothetical protein
MHHAGKIAGTMKVTPVEADMTLGPYIVRSTPAGKQVLRHDRQVVFLPGPLYWLLVECLPDARVIELFDQVLLSTVAAKRDGGRDATAKLQRELRQVLGMNEVTR